MEWLRKLFARETPPPLITDQQLKARVLQAVLMVVAEKGIVTGYDLLESQNLAIQIFMANCPYTINRKALLKARHLIRQYEAVFTGKLI